MAQGTPNDIPRNPDDSDSVYLVALQKTSDGYCGRKATPIAAAKREFIEIGCAALEKARTIRNSFDPDADDDFNTGCIASESDIWDRGMIDIVDNYQNLTNLDLSKSERFNAYALIFVENRVSADDHEDKTSLFAVFRQIDITRPVRGHKYFLTLNGNEIKKLDNPLLEISTTCDIVYTGDRLYVLRIQPFYKLFRSLKGNKGKVQELVNSFINNTKNLSFDPNSLNLIQERAQVSVRFANRLDSVVRKYKRRSPTKKQIVTAIKTVGAQQLLKLNPINGNIQFDAAHVDDVLKFLNEDLFKSIIFNEKYAASSKRRIQ